MKLCVNLGCGTYAKASTPNEEWVNVDLVQYPGVNIIHDLTVLPLPFDDNTCDEIILSHILEHLPDYPSLMEDIYRICKKGAIIKISVPHLTSRNMWNDPTHIKFFIERTFHYFVDDGTIEHNPWQGRNWNFKLDKSKIIFGWWFMKPIEWVVNIFPDFYENHLMFILQPTHIEVELEVLK